MPYEYRACCDFFLLAKHSILFCSDESGSFNRIISELLSLISITLASESLNLTFITLGTTASAASPILEFQVLKLLLDIISSIISVISLFNNRSAYDEGTLCVEQLSNHTLKFEVWILSRQLQF